MTKAGRIPNVVVLSTANFDAPIWTNKQHLAVGLSSSTKVRYIESMGLRRPRMNGADVLRVVRTLRSRVGSPRANGVAGRINPASVELLSPPVLPFHANRIVHAFNKKSMHTILMAKLGDVSSEVLWTFSPLTYGIDRHFGATVYHAVDLLHTIPGVNSQMVLKRERELLSAAEVVIASSVGVRDHLIAQGRQDVLLWENVAQTALFADSRSRVRKSRAIFAGNLTPTKLDLSLLLRLVDEGIRLVLAGPMSIDGEGVSSELKIIVEHPMCEYLGNLSPHELACEIGASKVGIIPYLSNRYTAGVFPMKVYEYLAGGLSVVATALPSLCGRGAIQGMTIAASSDEFLEAVMLKLAEFNDDESAARSTAALSFSWHRRIRDCVDLLGELA